MSADDWAFLLSFLNFGTALLVAVIIVFKRHGEPEPKYTYRVMGLPFVRHITYESETYMRDTLSDEDGAIVRKMLTDGVRLSHRAAQDYGATRPTWNRIRYQLVKMGLVERMEDGRIVARVSLYTYLGISLPRPSVSPDARDTADTTRQNTEGG